MRNRNKFTIVEIKKDSRASYFFSFFRSSDYLQADESPEKFFRERRPEAIGFQHLMIKTPAGDAMLYYMDAVSVEPEKFYAPEQSIPFLTDSTAITIFLDCIWLIPLQQDSPAWIFKKYLPDYMDAIVNFMNQSEEMIFNEFCPFTFPQKLFFKCPFEVGPLPDYAFS